MADAQLTWQDYQETLAGFRDLADTRFKLLTLLPSVSGIAIGLITFDLEQFKTAPGPRLMVGLLGLAVTLGLTLYSQRNSQVYNALVARGRALEAQLGLLRGGQLSHRPPRSLLLFGVFQIWHDRALALIYGSVLGAWLFPVVCGALWMVGASRWGLPVTVPTLAGGLALLGAVGFILELHRLDRAAARVPKVVEAMVPASARASGPDVRVFFPAAPLTGSLKPGANSVLASARAS